MIGIMVQFFNYLDLCKGNAEESIIKKETFSLTFSKTFHETEIQNRIFRMQYMVKYVANDSRSDSNMYLATVRFNVEILKRVTRAGRRTLSSTLLSSTHFYAIKYMSVTDEI